MNGGEIQSIFPQKEKVTTGMEKDGGGKLKIYRSFIKN